MPPMRNGGVPLLVKATPPVECDWRVRALCDQFRLLGMCEADTEGGVLTVDIGHLLETAVANVFEDKELLSPVQRAARETWEQEELAALREAEPEVDEMQQRNLAELRRLAAEAGDGP